MASSSASQAPQVFSTPKSRFMFRPGKPLSRDCKQVILNVYITLREGPSSVREVTAETARLTGVSAATIARIKAESKQQGCLRSPKRFSLDASRKPSRPNITSKVDSFDTEAIRRKVHQFFSMNEIPTITKMLSVINEDDSLPNFSRTSLYRLLRSMDFKFRKSKRDSALLTRTDLIDWRRRYLTAISAFRSAGKTIYYMDETWLNAGHTKSKIWHDETVKCAQGAWTLGLSTGLKTPSGKGSRLIITHAGNEDGFVSGALDIFEGKKGTGDYHEEMDGNRFEDWLTKKLLPNIKPNSVLVLDNASYHSVQAEKLPSTKTKKAEIQEWLTSKCVPWTANMLVKDLLVLVDSVRGKYTEYNVNKIAEAAGHTVLRLPPYHCELNPIELVWSQVKGYVASRNKSFKMSEARVLLQEALARTSPSEWTKCVNHVKDKVEKRFLDPTVLINTEIEPFIIRVDGDSESSDDEDGVELLDW